MQFNKGITRLPDDFTSPDGDLMIAANVCNDKVGISPLDLPEAISGASFPSGYKLLLIHKGNYIVFGGGHLRWYSADDLGTTGILLDAEPSCVTAIGNTLVASTSKICYFLWKNDTYKLLQDIPEIAIQFGLRNNFDSDGRVTTSEDDIDLGGCDNVEVHDYLSYGGTEDNYNEKKNTEWPQKVFAVVNKFVADQQENGKVLLPFLVRYAYRMYDGSLTRHSSPVLMVPNSRGVRIPFFKAADTDTSKVSPQGRAAAFCCDVTYYSRYTPTSLDDWSDIIKSIDIYISAPIYPYDINGKVTGWSATDIPDGGWANLSMNEYSASPYYEIYRNTTLKAEMSTYGARGKGDESYSGKNPMSWLSIPQKETDAVTKEISECSLFYKVASLSLDTFESGTIKKLELPNINNVATLQQMDDDYLSHYEMTASAMFSYNNRLNLAGVAVTPRFGTPLRSYFDRVWKYSDIHNSEGNWRMFVYLNKNGKTMIVENDDASETSVVNAVRHDTNYLPCYVFYPDTDAYQVVFKFCWTLGSETVNQITLPLTQHPFLNGAYWCNGLTLKQIVGTATAIASSVSAVEYPNKLYTSNADNPFVFQPSNINTIGNGTIKALSCATQALSLGQFGQFPLYAFTTEGIWALSVNSTGGWSSIQPITRDVLSGSPLQTDHDVAFMSARGLMIISGSQSVCVSDILRGDNSIPGRLLEVLATDNVKIYGDLSSSGFSLPENPLLAFDYSRQRIYLFSQDDNISWVYCLRSKSWFQTTETFDSCATDYPDTVFSRSSSTATVLYRLGASASRMPSHGLIATRPVKFDSLGLKTINTIVPRGTMPLKIVLLGSRDLSAYSIVSSSDIGKLHNLHGSPYRGFIILLCADCQGYLTMADIQKTDKLRNKIR